MRQAFRFINKDCDNKISYPEFVVSLENLGFI
jgi:Ca2+-binding EF-hand superfamily protein